MGTFVVFLPACASPTKFNNTGSVAVFVNRHTHPAEVGVV